MTVNTETLHEMQLFYKLLTIKWPGIKTLTGAPRLSLPTHPWSTAAFDHVDNDWFKKLQQVDTVPSMCSYSATLLLYISWCTLSKSHFGGGGACIYLRKTSFFNKLYKWSQHIAWDGFELAAVKPFKAKLNKIKSHEGEFYCWTTRWVVYSWAEVETVNCREAASSSQTHLVEPSHRSAAVCRQINSTQIKCTHTPAIFPVQVLKPGAHSETEMLKQMSLLTLRPTVSVAPTPTSHLPHPQVTYVCRVSYGFTYGSALLNEYEIKGGFVEDYHSKIPDLCMSARGRCWSAHVDRHKLRVHYGCIRTKMHYRKKKHIYLSLKMSTNYNCDLMEVQRNSHKAAVSCGLLSRMVVMFFTLITCKKKIVYLISFSV